MRFLLAIALPLVIVALVVPLVLGMVPPNDIYGFRTARTMSSPEIWYPANRIAGWCMAGSAAAELVFNFDLLIFFPEWPVRRYALLVLGATPLWLLPGLVCSFYRLRRI